MKQYLNLVDGQWVGADLPAIDVVNPSTEKAFATVPGADGHLARAAVDAAHRAFPEWAAASAYERAALLSRWHGLIEEHLDEFAETMTLEQGKPRRESRDEMKYANGYISWYAEEAKRVYGETIPATQRNKRLMVQRQPVGVVAVITPWNFPAAMIARKVAPALAAGCTVVIKPASQTPLTAIKLVEMAGRAGIPPGVVNLVTGSASAIGRAWLEDDRVRKLTFTGSTEVGRGLMRQCADSVKRLSLELGGNAPVIVTDRADVTNAVKGVVAAKFRNSGQTCICPNRIYVQGGIHDAFVDALIEAVGKLKMGDGLEEGTEIGPLIDRRAVDHVLAQIEQASAAGATVRLGGRNPRGLFIEPTVLTGVDDTMDCMVHETFGPLAPVARFGDLAEAVRRANDTIFGLASYVFSEDLAEALSLADALEFGIVGVNDGAPSTPQAPFGGMKQSGIGREGGRAGIEEYLETKYISWAR